jgi:hypothetical protein
MDAPDLEPHPDWEIRALELALLRRGVSERRAKRQACARCRRTPLVGERIYLPEAGVMLCELCRPRDSADGMLVHGPEFGHTLRLPDRSAA